MIEILQILGLLGPAESGERPQSGGEPGVQSIGILGEVGLAADRALFGHGGRNDNFSALVAVIGGDPVAPPELAADAPVADIVGPVEIDLLHPLGDELDITLFDSLDGGLDQLVHLDEPLFFDQGLDSRAAAVMGSDIVGIVLDTDQKAHLFQFFDDLLSGLIAVHAFELGAVFVDGGVVVHDIDLGQAMALSDLKVVGVVGGSDLDNAGTEFTVDIGIRHDRDLAVNERKPDLFADQTRIALILGVNRHSSITKHGLGTCRRKLQKTGRGDAAVVFDQRIFDMPEMAVLLFVLHFRVGNGGLADRAPVDDAASLIDPALLVHLAEDFRDGLVAALVHGKALAVPVTGGAELLELVDDPSAVLLAPVPAVLQELLAAQVLLVDALLFKIVDDLDFRSDGGVIGAGLPEGIVPLHALPADQNVLHRIVQGMAHVELSRDVRRGDDDREGSFGVVHFRVEVLLLLPVFIDPVLNSLRIISLGEHLTHFLFSLVLCLVYTHRLLRRDISV